jgi:hypothetical protein
MPKERIDEVYQSNWRYNMAEYYRGFKNKNKSKNFTGMKSGIYRGVKWYETNSTSNTDQEAAKRVN